MLPVLWGLVSFYIVRADFDNSLELATQFQTLAKGTESDDLIMTGDYLVAASRFWRGELGQARAPLERFVQHADPETNPAFQMAPTENPLIDTLSYMAWISWLSGYPDQGAAYSQRCIELARSLNSFHDLAYALGFAAWCRHLRREYHLVDELADELLTVAMEQEFPHWLAAANILKGDGLVQQQKTEEGVAQIDTGLEIWGMTGALLMTPSYQQVQADAYMKSGQLDKALELIDNSLSMVEKSGERISESELRRFRAEVLQYRGDFDQARANYQDAIDIARNQGAVILELRALVALGVLERDHGAGMFNNSRIVTLLNDITEGLDTPDLQDARAFLAG